MKTVLFNGREIKTNLGDNYSFDAGNGRATMVMKSAEFTETDCEMFERLAACGYSKIMFFYVTTSVRGYYNLIAYCK